MIREPLFFHKSLSILRTFALWPLVYAFLGQLEMVRPLEAQTSLSTWAQLRFEDLSGSEAQGEQSLAERVERIRAMYFLSVDEGKWADRARDSISVIRSSIPPDSEEGVTFEAYRGALQIVRAKHARWPGNKLKHLQRGVKILDRLVAENPANLEVRYLRLASYLFLPFFLRRDDSVAVDLQTLAGDLPEYPDAFSPPVYQAVVRFVLENGALEGEERTRLENVLKDGALEHEIDQGRLES